MGLVVAAIGGPKRLSTQVRGVAEGFFVPLFFVVLGARLDVSALIDHPELLLVTGSLIVLNVVVHAVAALTRASRRLRASSRRRSSASPPQWCRSACKSTSSARAWARR